LTSGGGIITALDPGKYGPLTVTNSITINGNGWAAITAPAAGNGITVNAPGASVALSGLAIDGAGARLNGIAFTAGASLTVTNCVLQNFVFGNGVQSGYGILIQPSSGTIEFVITNTTVANNVNSGIAYLPTGSPNTRGTIDHVVATANLNGILITTSFSS